MPSSANRRSAARSWSCAGEPYAIGVRREDPEAWEVPELWCGRRRVARCGPAYGKHVDPQPGGPGAQLRCDRAQGPLDPVELGRAETTLGRRVIAARLDLDRDPDPAAPAQDVDLPVAGAQVVLDDAQSEAAERGVRGALAGRAAGYVTGHSAGSGRAAG